jgi:aspartyl-tRNA(Asn)/glutamyl-tRNA(Gln) amidotransferase subunit C
MPLSRNEVEHVARLAHLGLETDEIDEMTEQLSSIVDHVARLQEVDTSDIPPTAHVLPLENVMRDDEVRPSWPPDTVLANAPHRLDDLFEVQAIFD